MDQYPDAEFRVIFPLRLSFLAVNRYSRTRWLYRKLLPPFTGFRIKGADCQAGDVVGITGNTGRSTGEHLHMTIRHKGEYINPVIFLLHQLRKRIMYNGLAI